MNVGFSEAVKADDFACVIFHDVDLIPEDARNDYGCPSSPRHMSTAVSRMDYKLVLLSMMLLVLFKGLSHGILSYFGHVQNYL